MNLSDPRLQSAVQAAQHRIKFAVAGCADQVMETLGTTAAAAPSNRQRDLYLAAQFQLRRKIADFHHAFFESLEAEVAKELSPRHDSGLHTGPTDWQSLSLVDDDQVEALVSSDRLGQTIALECEWELREFDAHMASLLRGSRSASGRNPLRPEVLGKALHRAVAAVSGEVDIRKALASEIGRLLSAAMRGCYTAIVADLRGRGVQAVALSVRTVEGPGRDYLHSGYDTLRHGTTSTFEETLGLPGETGPVTFSGHETLEGHPRRGAGAAGDGLFGRGAPSAARADPVTPGAGAFGASPARGGDHYPRYAPPTEPSGFATSGSRSRSSAFTTTGSRLTGSSSGSGSFGGGPSTRGGAPSTGSPGSLGPGAAGRGAGQAEATFGSVDAQMMSLLRRLTFLGNLDSGPGGLAASTPVNRALGGTDGPAGTSDSGDLGTQISGLMAANLIRAHRDELRQASSGALDHMVIDVVGSLFDQILSDPKVPPQMARQIARLQLPVLRAALGDVTFFSSRRHPVRRFVNRIASLACAFEDFDEDPGKRFLELVRELVQEIVGGDFDQMDLYEAKLADLQAFIAEQTERDVGQQGDAPSLLAVKEDELRLQQRYLQQLTLALGAVPLPDFMRNFLCQVWSQTIVQVSRTDGADSERARRMRVAARDLVMSIQPKGAPAQRKAFLLSLPQLMKSLNEGLSLIGWPDEARKGFFATLLPAHAESLKSGSMSELDHNMLVKQLDSIFGAPLPRVEELRRGDVVPVLDDIVLGPRFSSDEAERLGLVDESRVDWDGTVDIEVGGEPELTAVDINIDGLPPMEPPEPSHGAGLVDHIQLGFAYQMHLNEEWQKVRLSYVSPGRAFFVFTRGRKHQQTISMTSRMLTRMCETGRLRAFENAYLIERATARARKQLAALSAESRH